MNILSIDIEEPWHTIPRKWWYEESCRSLDIPEFIDRLRSVVEHRKVTPVFFVVGTVAEKHKRLFRELSNSEFVLASHSYDHEDFSQLQGDELQQALIRCKSHLEDLVGREVTAFRAPAFAVADLEEFWAALQQAGFLYDFSVCEAAWLSGGGHDAGIRVPTKLAKFDLFEFPMSVYSIFGRTFYLTGGGYFRLSPDILVARMQRLLDYNMFYLHPIDFLKPEFSGRDPRSLQQRFRQGVNVGDPWRKLERALSRQDWHTGSIEQWAEYYE